MGPNNLQNVNGQIRPSPDAEPDCSKGASSNVCKVSASLDQLTICDNTGRIAEKEQNHHGVASILTLNAQRALQSDCMQDGARNLV